MTPFALLLAMLIHADPAAPEPATAVALGDTVRIQVTFLHPSGAVLPAGGAGVRLERRRMPRPGEDGAPEVMQAWKAVAAADGLATFTGLPPLGTAESDRVLVGWHGATTEAALSSPDDGKSEPLRVVVRETRRDMSALKMSVQITLSPNDSGIQVDHLFQIDNPTHATIDTDEGEGLVLPLVSPAPFDEPVESFLPVRPDSRSFLTQQSPDAGRVVVENGRLVFRGPVDADGTKVRAVYLLPYASGTDHTYGLRMPVAASTVALVVMSSERVLPEVAFRDRSELLVRGEERTLILVDPPKAGGVVLFDVRGTPDRHVFYRPLAAGLGAVVLAALVVLALSRRRSRAR